MAQVSEGLKQEHYLTEMEVLLRDADLTSMFVALHKDRSASQCIVPCKRRQGITRSGRWHACHQRGGCS